MSWITGSSSSTYIDVLDKLIKAATGDGATGVSIVSGVATTGAYVVGDILTVSGGTADFAAKIRVTAVSSGDITAAVISEGGAYTSNPSNPVSVTGGGGTGATFNLTFASNGWSLLRRSQEAASATVGSGGSGGTNGTQTVTLGTTGAVGVTTNATFSVTVSGGAITAVLGVVTPGLYEEVPTNPVAVTGAGLTGATLNVTWAYPTTQDHVAVLEGTGGGSDSIICSIRTYQATNGANTAHNWSLRGMTAFNAGLTVDSQAGISPAGITSTTLGGAFVPLHTDGATYPLDFWFSVTPNRILGIVKVRDATVTHYASFYFGFVNRFGSPSEWPYPLLIAGCTNRYNALFNSTILTHVNSIAELISITSGEPTMGPAHMRRSDGTWVPIRNSAVSSDESSPTRSSTNNRIGFPIGKNSLSVISIDNDDNITADPATNTVPGFTFAEITATSGVPGTPTLTLHPTPDTGGAKRRLYPISYAFALNGPPVEKDIYGEMDGVFWVSAADVSSPLVSEDYIEDGDARYRVFQSGNRALSYTYFAVLES